MKFTAIIAITVISIVASLATVDASPTDGRLPISMSSPPPLNSSPGPKMVTGGTAPKTPPVNEVTWPRSFFENLPDISREADYLIRTLNGFKQAILQSNLQNKGTYTKDIDTIVANVKTNKIPVEKLNIMIGDITKIDENNVGQILSRYANNV
ncbi:hypothetical protein BDF22DRAFT_662572 [Syncephalis plumigaleata]|nr:hypothetical protein BDF22DRAFT_662572 [Syncephalis plumigaleata]